MVCLLTRIPVDAYCFMDMEENYPTLYQEMPGMNPSSNEESPQKPCEYPPWLDDLILANFFVACAEHQASPKSERNYFCIKCCGDSLCSYCVSKSHSGPEHHVLQIRRSSYKEAVRVSDVGKLVDLTDIQIYVINSARIVFINSRPQDHPSKGVAFSCETCHRTLIDSNKYCSLQCKLEALSDENTVNLMPKSSAVLPSPSVSVLKAPSPVNYHSDSSTQEKEKAKVKELKVKVLKVKEVKAEEERVKTPKIPKRKRKLAVYLKDEREVFSKEYDFASSDENPASVSSPTPKRRRTPSVILNVVNYQPNTSGEDSPRVSDEVPLSPNTPRQRSRKGFPHRAPSN